MKKRKNVLLFTFMVVVAILCMVSTKTEAASTKSKALKVYKKFLSQKTIKWAGSGKKIKLSKCEFSLIYLDNDSVPELILSSGNNENTSVTGEEALYTYKNGKLKYLDYSKFGFFFYMRKGVYYPDYASLIPYRQLSKGKVRGVLDLFYTGLNGSKPTYTYYKITNSSTGEGKYISKAEYTSYFKKLVGSKKAKGAKFHKNTANNRKKYIK